MDFSLPELGEGIYEAELVRWLVKPGDSVKRGQTLLEVMTDKATMEVPAPFAGRVTGLLAEAGRTVKVGQPVLAYTASWTGWFLSDNGYDRHVAGGGIIGTLKSWVRYQHAALKFHEGLDSGRGERACLGARGLDVVERVVRQERRDEQQMLVRVADPERSGLDVTRDRANAHPSSTLHR